MWGMSNVSYSNWDIPSNIFSITPIAKETIHHFIGRNKIVQNYLSLLKKKKIIVVFEGDIGTGKTSLGNYIRFSEPTFFTTDIEIMY